MPEPKVMLDSCCYDLTHGGTMILSGWGDFGSCTPVFQARQGKRSIPLSWQAVERPDVVAAHPEIFNGPGLFGPGFEIRIAGMEDAAKKGEPVYVRAKAGGEIMKICRKSPEEIKTGLGEGSLKYLIEKTEKRCEDVWIRGWYVSPAEDAALIVLGDGMVPVKGLTLRETRRMDLSEAFGAEMSACHGFELSFPRRAVRGRKAVLRFVNKYISMDEAVDLCMIDAENTRAGKIIRLLSDKKENKEIIKAYGYRDFFGYLMEQSVPYGTHYDFYEKKTAASSATLKKHRRANLSPSILFSVVTMVDSWGEDVDTLYSSLSRQSYGNWELIIVSHGKISGAEVPLIDRRLKWAVSSHSEAGKRLLDAAGKAEGDFVLFARPGSILTPDTLYQFISVIHPHPETDVIYGDTDFIADEKHCIDPLFKPEFDPDFLRSINYIGLPVVFRGDFLKKTSTAEGSFPEKETWEDCIYRLLNRAGEEEAVIRHIPRIICHNPVYSSEEELRRTETGGAGKEIRIDGSPKVSILIPNKDHTDDLKKCLDSIRGKSTWKNYEIIIIENNSTEPETEEYYRSLGEDPRIRIVRFSGEFNYSAINNFGAAAAKGEYLVLLNNDTEVITPDWLEQMLFFCMREGTGIAGAKLFYPDDTIQHVGIVVGIGGIAGHLDLGREKDYAGPMQRNCCAHRVSAVTGACMMVKTSVFRKIDGLDPEFAVALNDVDFCLRAGYVNEKTVFVPGAMLYHYESKSRGLESTPEKTARFEKECALFRERHSEFLLKGDPCYNPNLTLSGTDGCEKNIFRGSEEAKR